jgi:hypothetical protein
MERRRRISPVEVRPRKPEVPCVRLAVLTRAKSPFNGAGQLAFHRRNCARKSPGPGACRLARASRSPSARILSIRFQDCWNWRTRPIFPGIPANPCSSASRVSSSTAATSRAGPASDRPDLALFGFASAAYFIIFVDATDEPQFMFWVRGLCPKASERLRPRSRMRERPPH